MSRVKLETTSAYILARLQPGETGETALDFARWFYKDRGQYKQMWISFDQAFRYWKDGGR